MTPISKRTILFITFLLFALVACNTTTPTAVPAGQTADTSPVPKVGQPTATSLPAREPTTTPTVEIIPTETQLPIDKPPSMGGSSGIVFGSNRDSDYTNIYLLNTGEGIVTRLTTGDSNTFPGPFSPNGEQLLFTGYGLTNSFIGLINADGTDPVDLSGRPATDEGFPAWSPDGQQIVFATRMDGNNEIYIMGADGTNLKRLTNNPADDFGPAWSPDGSKIAFVSDRDNPIEVNNLYLMNVDGSTVTRLTNGDEIDYGPVWSPDGSQIAFRADINGNGDIYVINADGSNRVNLTNNAANDWAPAWSPDGSLIAFQTDRDGNWEIYVMHTDGSLPANLTQNPADDQMPYWKPVDPGIS